MDRESCRNEEGYLVVSKNPQQRPVKSINEKFDFMTQVFSPPEYRTKQKASPLTPIRAAVTGKIAQYYNLERGFSFVSERRMAEEIGCSQASVNNALQWLESKGHLKRIDGAIPNKVGRYIIFLQDDQSRENNHVEQSHEYRRADKTQEGFQVEHSHRTSPKRNNGTKGEVKGSVPTRCRSRRKAAAPSLGTFDVEEAMKYLRG